MPRAVKIPSISDPPLSPALSTSAQATPSGKRSSFCSMIIGRLRGIIITTPITPPAMAISVVSQ